LDETITTSGSLATGGTLIYILIVTIVTLFNALLYDPITTRRECTAVEASIAHGQVPIIALLCPIDLSVSTPSTDRDRLAAFTR